ncbi:hypothetical protein J2W96_006564 [Variovorax guangxiensis]|nr:hypothetical protein [Variovorax guangxiensis]
MTSQVGPGLAKPDVARICASDDVANAASAVTITARRASRIADRFDAIRSPPLRAAGRAWDVEPGRPVPPLALADQSSFLRRIEKFDLASLPVDGADSQHLQIEAMKLAFGDVHRHVAELSSMEVTTEQMLDDAYLESRAKLIDMKRAQDIQAGNPVKGGTIYLTAADENGMMVSFIQSNYMGFGSGCVEPDFGISLQNRPYDSNSCSADR